MSPIADPKNREDPEVLMALLEEHRRMLRRILSNPLDNYISDSNVQAEYNDLMAEAEQVLLKADASIGKLDEIEAAEEIEHEPTDLIDEAIIRMPTVESDVDD